MSGGQVEALNQKQHGQTDPRYRSTKTGLVGAQRDTMLESELQLLAELGKSRRRGHKLPPSQFTYGVSFDREDGGVAEALRHWSSLGVDADREIRYKVIRDFIALNKAAAKSGCINAKENNTYRSLNDIKRRIRIGGNDIFENGDVLTRKPIEFPKDLTFGLGNRPSTPIHDIINHHYLYDWLDRMQNEEAQRQAKKKEATIAISGAYHTKASWLKQSKIPVEDKPLWKMPRFRNATAAVDTFDHERARKNAFSVNELDKVPRHGVDVFRQGVYNVETTALPQIL